MSYMSWRKKRWSKRKPFPFQRTPAHQLPYFPRKFRDSINPHTGHAHGYKDWGVKDTCLQKTVRQYGKQLILEILKEEEEEFSCYLMDDYYEDLEANYQDSLNIFLGYERDDPTYFEEYDDYDGYDIFNDDGHYW